MRFSGYGKSALTRKHLEPESAALHAASVRLVRPPTVYTRALPRSGVHVSQGTALLTQIIALSTDERFVGSDPATYSCHAM